jgi:seryl-tRNA synthetase
MQIRYPMEKIKKTDFSELTDHIYYLDPNVKMVRVENGFLTIQYEGSNERLFLKQLEGYLKNDERTIKRIKLCDNRVSSFENKDYLDAKEIAVFKGDALKLHKCLKEILDRISEKHKATPTQYPALMNSELMQRSKYFFHFPQNIYRLTEIRHQKEQLDKCRLYMNKGLDVEELFEVNDFFLRPCLCYFAYDERKDQRLTHDLEVVNSYGSCFRHEHKRKISKHRSRDFTMYELIYFGSKEKVEKIRKQLIQEIWELFKRIGLSGYIETANDPFFINNDRNLIAFQRGAEMKYELVFSPNENTNFSIGSFNLVGDVLTESFGIKSKQGEKVYSGCTAFGLDRWVRAILYTFGENMENWPAYLREKIANGK